MLEFHEESSSWTLISLLRLRSQITSLLLDFSCNRYTLGWIFQVLRTPKVCEVLSVCCQGNQPLFLTWKYHYEPCKQGTRLFFQGGLSASKVNLNSLELPDHIQLYIYLSQKRPVKAQVISPVFNYVLLSRKQILPWLVWLSGLSTGLLTKRSLVWFPLRVQAWVSGQVPKRGCLRGNYRLMFLSLSFSLLSPF